MSPKGKLSQYVCYLEPQLRLIAYNSKFDNHISPIIVNPGKVPNNFLHLMYQRYNKIFDMNPDDGFINKIILKIIYSLNYIGYKNFTLLKNNLYVDSNWIWNELPCSLEFSKKELEEGKMLLDSMGISLQEKFVILHLREEHYYNEKVDLRRNPEASNEYSLRNPDINDYKEAINFLVQEGYKVVKTGFPGSKCDIDLEGFIDYANKFRTEFGDIFLHSKAEFVISGSAGNFQLASVFGTPSILTNSYDFQVKPLLKNDMYLPLTYRNNKNGELLPISSMLEGGVELSSKTTLKNNNLTIIHNSKEELLSAVKEMHENIVNSTETKNLSIEEIQLNYLFKPHHIGYKLPSRISLNWLKKYKVLIK